VNVRMNTELRFLKDVEGSGRGPTSSTTLELSLNGREEHENSQYSTVQSRFEPGISRRLEPYYPDKQQDADN
jgi:hypothetical protein